MSQQLLKLRSITLTLPQKQYINKVNSFQQTFFFKWRVGWGCRQYKSDSGHCQHQDRFYEEDSVENFLLDPARLILWGRQCWIHFAWSMINSMKKTVLDIFCFIQDWFYEEDSVGSFLLDPGLILWRRQCWRLFAWSRIDSMKKTVLDTFCLIQDWFYEEDSVGYFLLDPGLILWRRQRWILFAWSRIDIWRRQCWRLFTWSMLHLTAICYLPVCGISPVLLNLKPSSKPSCLDGPFHKPR